MLPEPMRCGGVRNAHVLIVLAALAASGCTRIDNALASIPFFSSMHRSPAVGTYEMPRAAPPGAVPYQPDGGEILPPQQATDAALRAFAATPRGRNPVAPGEASLARGLVMYERYCLVCHGLEGLGRETGPVTSTGAYPPIAPPVSTGAAVELPDGYLYGVIRVGRGLMPAYGGQVSHMDRWHIVNYMRSLQQGAAGEPSGGAVGVGN